MSAYPLITISRQYAAYGRTVAKGLSERLGIPYYDRDFVKKTAESSGYAEEDIIREGEDISKGSRFWNSFLNNATVYSSSYDGIFAAESKVILELSQEPCIIVGRSANHVLSEAGIPAFHVFLYADLDKRIQRAAELGENGNMDLRKYVQRRDTMRETYCKLYTGSEMSDYSHYHICLDSGFLGPDKCVDILADILQQK